MLALTLFLPLTQTGSLQTIMDRSPVAGLAADLCGSPETDIVMHGGISLVDTLISPARPSR